MVLVFKYTIISSLLIVFCLSGLFAQEHALVGKIEDLSTGDVLVGASIFVNESTGTATDVSGTYRLNFDKPGEYSVEFSFVGFETQIHRVNVTGTKELNVALARKDIDIGQAVVTAGRYEQSLEEVTVSMEVIKREQINQMNPNTIEELLDQTPGVNVTKTQVSIRGGSSWNFGAGSRVLLLMDGLPMLSADARDIKFTALPLESIKQIEVIKGASSALYGSAALDGIINLRTLDPGKEPSTRINISGQAFGNPPNPDHKFWTSTPLGGRIQLMHARRLGDFSILASGDISKTDGYRLGETRQVSKAFFKLRHRPSKLKRLNYGVNFTVLSDSFGTFLFWLDSDNALVPDTVLGAQSRSRNSRWVIDPVVEYSTNKNAMHALRGRIFITDNKNNRGQNSKAILYYGEYQYRKYWELNEKRKLNWNHGLVGQHSNVGSDGLYGNHEENNYAAYGQTNFNWGRWMLSGGGRLEAFQIDTFEREYHPIFRTGITFRYMKHGFLRASAGQGIRFPSVAERFTETTAGGLRIFPNPSLVPEKAWSAELGAKQGYKLGQLKGYLDVAGFISEYKDMIEFTFGLWEKPLGFGFSAINVTDAQIYGLEAGLTGIHELKDLTHIFQLGYNYIVPLDIKYRDTLSIVPHDTALVNKYLKYRYQHFAKATYRLRYKFLTLSLFGRYNSNMLRIDNILYSLKIVSDLYNYRKDHDQGDLVIDAGLAALVYKNTSVGFHVKNIFNREYMYFPGNLGPPRNYTLRLSYRIN